jgi:vacuolar protein sorting-associated protein 45
LTSNFELIFQGPDGKKDFRDSEIQFLKTTENSLFSLFLAYKSIPTIRYSGVSPIAKKISERLSARLEREYTQNHQDFEDGSMELLVLDRRDDPISPLVYNWSYLGLVDELLGIQQNTVHIPKVFNQPVMFARNCGDEFLDEFWVKNFGETSQGLSKKLKDASRKRKLQMNKTNIEDMQELMLKMPEMQKYMDMLKKHSDIFDEVTRIINENGLYEVSELQQNISTEDEKGEHYEALLEIMGKENVQEVDKIKLCMLFAIKYSKETERIDGLMKSMRKRGLLTDYITKALSYCKRETSTTGSFFNKGSTFFKKATSQILNKLTKESPNYYERHVPKCVELAEDILKGKLATTAYPEINLRFFNDNKSGKTKRLVCFIIGGATHQECRELHKLAQESKSQILLGSNFILNSKK